MNAEPPALEATDVTQSAGFTAPARPSAAPPLAGSLRHPELGASPATGELRSPLPHPPQNAVFFEALGNGLVYSLDYERMLDTLPIGLRAGASFFTYRISDAAGSGNFTIATFPLLASYYLGSSPHKLQLGLGATLLYVSASSDATGTKYEGAGAGLGIAASGVVGYRYVPEARGITFGVAFTPLLRASKGFLPWGGASVGYAF